MSEAASAPPLGIDPEQPMTGASPKARELFAEAMGAYQCYVGDPVGLLNQAIADSPAFVLAHLLKTYIPMVGSNAAGLAISRAAHAAACGLEMSTAERGHLEAARLMLAGEHRAAGRILEDLSIDDPTDVLALQAGHLIDFLIGQTRMQRDRIARALPAWDEARPGYHAVMGMFAFGLEENGAYAEAEEAGRKAIALQPRNGWAHHAVAHVMEMQRRREEGAAWMRATESNWAPGSYLGIHNWWHLALFHFGLGDHAAVLELYDGPLAGELNGMAFDMVDAAAMLWRLNLAGVDVGDRWTPLADAWEEIGESGHAFNDIHAAMAFAATGREAALETLLAGQARAMAGKGDNAAALIVAGPVTRGIAAFGRGRYGEAVEWLRPVLHQTVRFGGSHAQRDVVDLTLIEAARRDGQQALAMALEAERAAAHHR